MAGTPFLVSLFLGSLKSVWQAKTVKSVNVDAATTAAYAWILWRLAMRAVCSAARLTSVQPEHALDRADLGRLDQPRMRHGDRVQRAFQGLQPEIEEFVECRKCRAEIVILPDIALEEPGMIRPPVENIGR